jgi:hypothetical protein
LVAAPSPADPAGIVIAIYTRAAKGKGDGGGAFIIENKTAKAKYLSKSLVELWAKADAHTPKGAIGGGLINPRPQSCALQSWNGRPCAVYPDLALTSLTWRKFAKNRVAC